MVLHDSAGSMNPNGRLSKPSALRSVSAPSRQPPALRSARLESAHAIQDVLAIRRDPLQVKGFLRKREEFV